MTNPFPFSLFNLLWNRDLVSSSPKVFICYFVWPPSLKDVGKMASIFNFKSLKYAADALNIVFEFYF